MAIALIQSNTNSTGSPVTTLSTSYLSNNGAGSLLVLGLGMYLQSSTSVTDSRNSWTKISGASGTNGLFFQMELWFAVNSGAGANTVTTNTPSGSYQNVWIAEFSGLALTNALDQVNYQTGTSATPDSGSVITTIADELLISYFGNSATNGLVLTPATGFTMDATFSGNFGCEYEVVGSIGTYNGGGAYNSSQPWQSGIASFKVPGGPLPSVFTSIQSFWMG